MIRSSLVRWSAAGIVLVLLHPAPAGAAGANRFQRADSNSDGQVDLTDALTTLGFLFLGLPPDLECEDAADTDDNGFLELTDGVSTLEYLFLGAVRPREPFGTCGVDPTEDGLSCLAYSNCAQGPPSPPVLSILPAATRLPSIEVGGTSGPGELIRIVGGAAARTLRSGTDGKFAVEVPLLANRLNRLFVTAEDAAGRISAPAAAGITQDGNPPFVSIDEPSDGAQVTAAEVTVTGRVADALSGFQGLAVSVNGQPASVAIGIGTNGTYERGPVPLVPGENLIQVTATDGAGNAVSPPLAARVTRIAPPGDANRLELVRGSGQSAPIHSELGAPLVVRALLPGGAALEGALVAFRVTRSDGLLAGEGGAPFADAARTLLTHTGANGEASAFLRLGTDAGCGNNRVTVTGEGLFGSVVFCASATPGPAAQINVGSGNNQRLETGAPAPERLRARVSDGCNGVAGVPVRFRVTLGTGTVNGLQEATVPTGLTGHAEIQFIAGPEPGPQFVEAGFEPPPDAPQAEAAVFAVFALERQEGRATSFAGVVLDNANQPLEGALCILEIPFFEGMTTRSSRDGQFRFDDLPGAGPASLRVDGYFASHAGGTPGKDVPQGTYPSLVFELALVSSASNGLPGPVLLPELDPGNRVQYDGTQEVELRVQGIDGLLMRVKAGTVVKLRDGTLASPASPIILSLNQVHHDDVPMPMPDGAAPPFAWTLQPGGATFDPPLSIEYPNMSGLPPGAIAYFLSYDHDTQRFEIVSSGHVAEDGSIIQSDPGQGISVAGWGCNCPPYSVTGECKPCKGTELGDKVKAGLTFAKDMLVTLAKVSDVMKCASAIASSAQDCLGAFEKVEADGKMTDEEAASVLSCANGIKTSITTCLKLAPDIAGLAETAKKVSDSIGAAINLAQEAKCLPRWANVALKVAESINNLVSKALDLAGKLDVKKLAMLGACTAMQAIIDRLELATAGEGAAGAGDGARAGAGGGVEIDLAELERGFAEFDALFRSSFDQDAGIQSDRESLDVSLPVLDADLKTVLTDLEQPALAGFVLKAGGQSADAGPDGGYRISNVSAPDLFGAGGPGTRPDSQSDDPVRVLGLGTIEGKTFYAFSEPFQLRQRQTYTVPALTLTDQPPPLPLSIAFTAGPGRLKLDESGQLTVTGVLGDGSTLDVTPRTQWTIYRSSNPSVVKVGPDGLATGSGRGIAFVTATNEGVTTVKRIDVDLDTVRVTLSGIARLADGTPAAGARIESIRGASATAGASGAFVLSVDVLPRSTFLVRVFLEAGGKSFGQTLMVDAEQTRIDLGVITLREAAPELFPGRSYPVEGGPRSVVTGDLDGDGSSDLGIANGGSNSVSILLNRGDGLFQAQVKYAVGFDPRSLTTADLDGDLDLDLATANTGSDNVSVLLNAGDGTFLAHVTYRVSTSPVTVTAADLVGDGAIDLVVADAGANGVSVLRNQGDGTFAAQATFSVGIATVFVAAADLDGDADADMVIANSGPGIISVLKNQGGGKFAAPDIFGAGSTPVALAPADLDGDADIDLAAANDISGMVSALLNQGGGSFAAPVGYVVGTRPLSVAAGDLDGDGDLDLAAANSTANSASVLRNQGNGTFADHAVLGVGALPQSVSAADLDMDGGADLATANFGSDSVTTLRNEGGAIGAFSAYGTGRFPSALAGADLDGDLDLDLAVLNSTDSTISLLRNQGDGTLATLTPFQAGFIPSALLAARLDSDGDVDLAVTTSNGLAVYLNRGDATFPAPILRSGVSAFSSMAAADLDGDADLDIATANYGFGTVGVLRNQGNGAFDAPVASQAGSLPSAVIAADLDGDGGADLAAANEGSGNVSVLLNLNQGDATFAAHVTYAVGTLPRSLAAADLDGDGDVDLAVANQTSGNVSVLLNHGDGTFASQVPYAAGPQTRSITSADFDGDGDIDLATTSFNRHSVSVLLNQGNGTFEDQRIYAAGSPSRSLAALDMNGDGAPDIVVANETASSVSVLLNRSRP